MERSTIRRGASGVDFRRGGARAEEAAPCEEEPGGVAGDGCEEHAGVEGHDGEHHQVGEPHPGRVDTRGEQLPLTAARAASTSAARASTRRRQRRYMPTPARSPGHRGKSTTARWPQVKDMPIIGIAMPGIIIGAGGVSPPGGGGGGIGMGMAIAA
uniref:Uncharacterized protein n=1 Tax=Oryza punctata TaxID=4537 RepID=A0A0E0KE73_ORYPU